MIQIYEGNIGQGMMHPDQLDMFDMKPFRDLDAATRKEKQSVQGRRMVANLYKELAEVWEWRHHTDLTGWPGSGDFMLNARWAFKYGAIDRQEWRRWYRFHLRLWKWEYDRGVFRARDKCPKTWRCQGCDSCGYF